MLNSLSNFLFGSAPAAPAVEEQAAPPMETTTTTTTPGSGAAEGTPCRLKETPAEEEWVLVDKSSREASLERHSTSSASPEFLHPASRRSAHATPTGGESSDSDIGSDISTLPDNACSGETWLVTPPPCFTAGGNSPQRVEPGPLENLLIEHPSMSVYGPRLRQNSAGIESDVSESSDMDAPATAAAAVVAGRRQIASAGRAAGSRVATRSSPRQPRAVAARAGLGALQQQTVRATEVATRRSKRKQLAPSQLARDNMTRRSGQGKRLRQRAFVMQPMARSANKRC